MSRKASIPDFLAAVRNEFGSDTTILTRSQFEFIKSLGVSIPGAAWALRINKQEWDISGLINPSSISEQLVVSKPEDKHVHIVSGYDMYIPETDPYFIPSGEMCSIIEKIISSGDFFPIYAYGPSGIGKTSAVIHSCATNRRPFFRAQITRETVDEDIIGTMKLLDGNTVWQDGAAMMAYRSGGVLLLDEVDLNNTLMILQPILEGRPFLIKQTGELVHPAKGFTVIATGNTRGDGSDSKHIGTTVLNAAFKERFALLMKYDIPSISVEKKIVSKLLKELKFETDSIELKSFFRWLELSRKAYESESVTEFISTRRVAHIIKSWKIFGNLKIAISKSLSIYDENTIDAFMMLFDSVYDKNNPESVDNTEE